MTSATHRPELTSPARRRPVVVAATVLTTLTIILGACTSDSGSSAPPESAGTTTATGTGIDWSGCGDGFDCATVPMPLDWDDPDGETIDLALIKRPASNPDERIGTILTNPGGPGDTGVGFVHGGGEELDAWGEGRFDWVGWDPRGTHASSPVDCFGSEAETAAFWDGVRLPSNEAEGDAYAERTTDLARRCGEAMGQLLSHISTTDTVRDMDRIRELLGEEKITYVGTSYGTVIGQFYANMFPEHVRAMMLDGIVDPVAYTTDAETRHKNGAAYADEVFGQFLATCETAGAERCALAGHGVTAAYSDVAASSFAALRSPELWPAYAEQLNDAVEGDASELVAAAAKARTPVMWAEATKSNAISCLDAPASTPVSDWPEVIGEIEALSAMAVPVQGWILWALCASGWPAQTADRFTGPWDAETEVPILLIGTRHDPNTGYGNAVRSEQLLGNAVLLTHEGYGHVSTWDPSSCIEAARPRYLVDLEVPAPGTVCQADQKPFSQ